MKPSAPSDLPPRREVLRGMLAALGLAGLSACAKDSVLREESTDPGSARRSGSLVNPGDLVLFQGDSITDAGRDRALASRANLPGALGSGYAMMAARDLLAARPQDDLRLYNRGVSGNKVFQLAERWEADCLELEPDVLSILIGVNDIWHGRSGTYDGTVEVYERDYDALLERTRAARPSVELVICEPFVLRCGAVDDSWFPEFDAYRAAAKRVALAHAATWVPFQSMFDAALEDAGPETWAGDGVHPSPAGAALMAAKWLEVVGEGRGA